MQAMIPLGNQLTYVSGSCILSARGSNHQLTATVLHDTLRIYSYSLSLTPFSGNSGDLLSFKLVMGEEPGNYALPLDHALLSSATGSSLNVSTSDGHVTILAPKIALSSTNINYGHIPIRSIYTQSLTVTNVGNEPLTLTGASFNDNTLSATGVSQTIAAGAQAVITVQYAPLVPGIVSYQAVIHSNAHIGDSIITVSADPFSVNELRLLPASGETDSIVTVSLRMNNMDSIVGLQTSIILPSALTYMTGSFNVTADRSQGHTATAGMLGDTLVLLVTSLENRPLHGGDGVVATFQLRLHGYGYYSLQLLQTVLSDSSGQNVLSAVYPSGVQIYSPSLSCNNSLYFGSTSVLDTARAVLSIHNNGNATMVIDQVVLTNSDFSLETVLPITIPAWQSGVLEVIYTGMSEGHHTAVMGIYSNDPYRPLVQVSLSADRYEPNYLFVSADANQSVENAAIDIELDNYSPITALQMDVVYPWQHYTMSVNDIHLTSRSVGHIVSSAVQNDSTVRVLILSMQNQAFSGNNGPVAHINLHAVDPDDEGHYPLRLNNVVAGGLDGVNRLSDWDSVVYIATRTVYDDTLYVDVHDTTYVDVLVYVYDTLYVNLHDTTYIDVFVPVYDTTYIEVHDTINIEVFDTTYVVVHDTTYVDIYVPVHDTTYIEVPYPVHDTTYVDVHDTTYLTVYDTTYVNIHDTTFITLTDTLYLWQHDTTYVSVFDTVVIQESLTWFTVQVLSDDLEQGIAAGNGQFPEGTVVEIAAIPFEGYRFLQWSDGQMDNPRSILVNGDILLTAQFETTSVDDYLNASWYVYPETGSFTVKGAEGCTVRVYDSIGKLLQVRENAPNILHCVVPASGTYIVQVDNGTAKKVTVVR